MTQEHTTSETETPPAPTVEELRKQMASIRDDLDKDVQGISRNMTEMLDWTHYVRSYPYASIGVAIALGYLAVPQRTEIVSPDADTLEKLAKKNRVVVETNPKAQAKGGVIGSLFTLMAGTVFRGATVYITQKIGETIGMKDAAKTQPAPAPQPSQRPPDNQAHLKRTASQPREKSARGKSETPLSTGGTRK